jgi:hypothetical protein
LVEDDERGGRPKSTRTEANNAAVADLVKNDGQIASRMIADSLNIPKTVVFRIMKEDLGKRKSFARFVPHSLTPEPTKLKVLANFDPKKLQPFITPVLSRFISARIFSVPQVKNEVKRTPLCGCY